MTTVKEIALIRLDQLIEKNDWIQFTELVYDQFQTYKRQWRNQHQALFWSAFDDESSAPSRELRLALANVALLNAYDEMDLFDQQLAAEDNDISLAGLATGVLMYLEQVQRLLGEQD